MSNKSTVYFSSSMLAIAIILFTIFITHTFFSDVVSLKTPDTSTLASRIKPIGAVYLQGDLQTQAVTVAKPVKTATKSRSGKEIYSAHCAACHSVGIAGAPKTGNASDWAPKLKLGIAKLVQTSIKGVGAMPPKGTCGTCSSDDLKAAIEYMSK